MRERGDVRPTSGCGTRLFTARLIGHGNTTLLVRLISIGAVVIVLAVRASAVADSVSNATAMPASSTSRPYSVRDALLRRQIGTVAVSPDGSMIAFDVERPAQLDEHYVAESVSTGDVYSRRSDLLVISASTGAVVWRTSGAPNGHSAFLPRWSPDSQRLAFLLATSSEKTVIATWARGASQAKVGNRQVNLAVPVRSDESGVHENTPFAWMGSDSILVVIRGDQTAMPLGAEVVQRLETRWRATWAGRPSFSLWRNEDEPVCGLRDELVVLDAAHPIVLESLVKGPIKGVSVARDRTIAYVVANGRTPTPARSPIQFPPLRNFNDLDQFVRWDVHVIARSRGNRRDVVAVPGGDGPVSFATLPRWSTDAMRLSGVTWRADNDGKVSSGAFLWSRSDQQVRRQATAHFDDARSIAFGYLNAPEALSAQLRLQGSGQQMARIEVDTDVARIGVDSLLLSGRAAPVTSPIGAAVVAVHGIAPERIVILRSATDYVGLYERSTSPARVKTASLAEGSERFVGLDPAGNFFFVSDTEQGSFVDRVPQTGTPQRLATFNTHFADVSKPRVIPLDYQVNGSDRQGMLRLPTRAPTAAPPPTIAVAYPRVGPLMETNGRLTRMNRPYAYYIAPLLAHGYAVFEVDFRLPHPLPSEVSPRENVLSEVLPAIAALNREQTVDASRLGFLGHSYGGYTALTLLADTNQFDAIVAYAPLGDLAQYSYSLWPDVEFSECAVHQSLTITRELEDPGGVGHEASLFLRLGAAQSMNAAGYLQNSPSLNLKNASTPSLLAVGEFDAFANGARATYLALARRHVPAAFVQFYGEDHLIKSPGNIASQCRLTLEWLDNYVKRQQDAANISEVCGPPAD